MKIRIGRLEIAFGVVLAIYLLLALTGVTGWVRLLGKVALGVLGFALAVRISRVVVKEMLWRLRNRLIVAYFFIAVVPLILITLLAGLGIALIGGQIWIFLVTSELERRTAGMRASMEFLARENIPDRAWAVPFLRSRYPGLELAIREKGVWRDAQGLTVPGPPGDWPAGSGLLVRDRKLYSWAVASHNGRSTMGLVPVTREFLGQLAPDIGEVTILNLESNEVLLHPSLDEPAASRNRIPPAANTVDFPIWWVAPVLANLWEAPATTQTEWLNIRTRPSAVLRTVLSQKVDFANEMVPAFFFGVAILFLIAEAIALMIGVSLTRTITGAVHELYEGTVRVMKGDLKHRIPPSGKDQLGELSVSFNNMTANMERLLAIEKERERLQTELEIAREVQNQLYPKRLPDVDSLRLTAVCNPARMVSGDYYDYQQIGKDVAIAVGDVAGKGISAALLMATVQSSFRAQLRGSLEIAAKAGGDGVSVSVSTSRVVSHLNQQLHADTAPEKYATFFLGVYDAAGKAITYTNAGHLPPILIRNGDVTMLEVNGMVVGAFPFAKYGESRVQLQPQDLLVFYTDGITEPENAYGEMFGEERLIELLVRNAGQDEAEIVTVVTDAVRQWTGTDELQDDMTLLLVRQL
jgi:phosphoserine phosphatase RsbU/P